MSDTKRIYRQHLRGSLRQSEVFSLCQETEEEGFKGAAKLFRAAAERETIHAHSHLEVLKGVKSTLENLKEAFSGEHHRIQCHVPGFYGQI